MFVCSSLNRSLQTASEGYGFLPASSRSPGTPEPSASPAVLPLSLFYYFLCTLASRLVLDSVADRFGFFCFVFTKRERGSEARLHLSTP